MEEDPKYIDEGLPEDKTPNSLQVWTWLNMYRDLPLSSQLVMLKKIMAGLNISFIKAGDMDPTRKFVWSLDEYQSRGGSLSSSILPSLGYMHASSQLHEKCSIIVRALIERGVEFGMNNFYLFRPGFTNPPGAESMPISIIRGLPLHIKIDLSPNILETELPSLPKFPIADNSYSLKDILENEELYAKFIDVWRPGENKPFPPDNDEEPDPGMLRETPEHTEEVRRIMERNDIIGEYFEDIDGILESVDDDTFLLMLQELEMLVGKYKRAKPQTSEPQAEKKDE